MTYFRKYVLIETTIGNLKFFCSLERNFHKGVFENSINVMLAAAAYNFKRAMKVLLCLIKIFSETFLKRKISLNYTF